MWTTNISLLDVTNITLTNDEELTIYDDYKDIIWPSIFGLFVTLALGWMICRYKCSSTERSPHLVQCCPKSLCRHVRRCCRTIFKSKKEPLQAVNATRAPESLGQDLPFLLGDSIPVTCSEPCRHPLRPESTILPEGRRLSPTQWPFQSTTIDFHAPTNEMRKTHLFFRT